MDNFERKDETILNCNAGKNIHLYVRIVIYIRIKEIEM